MREARYFFLNLARPGRAALTVAFGGSETCNPDYLIARSRFDYFGVEYVAQGEGSVVLDGVRSPLRPGSVFAYGRRTRCEIRSDPGHPLVKYFVCFGGSRAARVLSAGRPLPGGRRTKTNALFSGASPNLCGTLGTIPPAEPSTAQDLTVGA